MIAGALFAAALILYGTARYYSPLLVQYVVEQALMQKAPPGTDPDLLKKRLHAFLSEAPDRGARMKRLFRISEYLEKTQTLTPEELDELLGGDTGAPRRAA
jgi:hypothetical protein